MVNERLSNRALEKDGSPQALYELKLRKGNGNYEGLEEQREKDLKQISFMFGIPLEDLYKALIAKEFRDE